MARQVILKEDIGYTNIYSLTDPRTNQIRYIGQSIRLRDRMYEHKKIREINKRTLWIKELKDLGLFPKLDVLEKVCINDGKFWEMWYIDLFKSWGFDLVNTFTNNQPNWTANRKHTVETVAKMTVKMRERYANTDYKHPMLGKHHSEKSLKIIRERRATQIITKETIDKMLKTRRERKNCFKPILQYDLQGNFIKEWECGMDIIRDLGIKHANQCCRGERKIAGGFIWKFKEV